MAEGGAEGSLPVFDIEHLRRRTMDDQRLQIEILALFSAEAERLLRQAEEASDPGVRRDRISALGTLARGVGAGKLAAEAARVAGAAGDHHDLASIRRGVAEVLSHIAAQGE